MKIIYIANTRLPTEKAHGLATMKICEAFVRAGAELELIVPKLWRHPGDPFVFYDIHHFPSKNFMYQRVMKKSSGFAVQTRWKILALGKQFAVPENKIVYWPNGTDVEKFSAGISKDEARKKLGLSINEKIILYTGALFDWKGVNTLVLAVGQLFLEAKVYIVGGATIDVKNLKKRLPEANNPRIVFVPFQPHEMMPFWCKAADVLVLPNTGKQKVSLYYTSPMKLFEYLVSGTPMVVSNIPSITEIVDNSSAFINNLGN